MLSSSKVNKKIKIFFCVPSLCVGGIERQLVLLLKNLNHDRYEAHLITLFDYRERPNLFGFLPKYVNLHRMDFHTGVDFPNFFRLYKILKELKPEIVISSMVFPNTLLRFLKIFLRYKMITREHNTYTDKRLRHKFCDHILSCLSDEIVAVSSSVAVFAKKQAFLNRDLTVIHNGVDIQAIEDFKLKNSKEDCRKKIIEEFNLPKETLFVLNVARLKKQKNQKLLLDSFQIFSKDNPNYFLLIVGSGSEEMELKKHTKDINVEEKVIFTGYRQDVFTFFRASEFFVLSSLIEGFPNVGIEAISFGLPMITTNVSGVDEFILQGKNGFLVSSSPESLVEGMKNAIPLVSERQAETRLCCIETASRFSIKENVRKYQALFERVIFSSKIEHNISGFVNREERAVFVSTNFSNIFLESSSVLDVGCDLNFLKRIHGEKVTGVDISGKPDFSIDLERELLNRFDSEKFDTVVCLEVLEHVDNLHEVLDEIIRVAKNNILISLPNSASWYRIYKMFTTSTTGKFYGLPKRRPVDRHKWFFSQKEIVDFFLSFCEEKDLIIERIVFRHNILFPHNGLLRYKNFLKAFFFRFFHTKSMCQDVFILIRK